MLTSVYKTILDRSIKAVKIDGTADFRGGNGNIPYPYQFDLLETKSINVPNFGGTTDYSFSSSIDGAKVNIGVRQPIGVVNASTVIGYSVQAGVINCAGSITGVFVAGSNGVSSGMDMSAIGSIYAEHDVYAITGDIYSELGNVYSTSGYLRTGPIATSGIPDISGIGIKVVNSAFVRKLTVDSSGNINTAGNLSCVNVTASGTILGNIVNSTGLATVGALISTGIIIGHSGMSITAGASTVQSLTADGTITAISGLNSSTTLTAVSDISSSAGNIYSTVGYLRSGPVATVNPSNVTDINSGSGVGIGIKITDNSNVRNLAISQNGNIDTNGTISSKGIITAQGGLVVSAGDITVPAGLGNASATNRFLTTDSSSHIILSGYGGNAKYTSTVPIITPALGLNAVNLTGLDSYNYFTLEHTSVYNKVLSWMSPSTPGRNIFIRFSGDAFGGFYSIRPFDMTNDAHKPSGYGYFIMAGNSTTPVSVGVNGYSQVLQFIYDDAIVIYSGGGSLYYTVSGWQLVGSHLL